MKKVLLLVLATALSIPYAQAQLSKSDEVKKQLQTENVDTTAWTHAGTFNLGFNEGFLHNWAAGGELASLTTNGLLSVNLTRLAHKNVWSNNLDLCYGLIYAYSTGFLPKKTDDRIDFTSKFGHRVDTSNFYITGLFNFKSQFTKGYDYTYPNWDSFSTSKFLSPAYLTLAIGMEYRKGSDLSLFLSPLAARATFVSKYYTLMKPDGAYGVENGKTSRFEVGAYFSGRYVWNISKSTTFKTRADLYCNYLAKNATDSTGKVVKRDNPGNIDVLWDNLLSVKVSKYISLTLGATFIYDNDIPYSKTKIDATTGLPVDKKEPGEGLGWLQLKQVFALGLEYKF